MPLAKAKGGGQAPAPFFWPMLALAKRELHLYCSRLRYEP